MISVLFQSAVYGDSSKRFKIQYSDSKVCKWVRDFKEGQDDPWSCRNTGKQRLIDTYLRSPVSWSVVTAAVRPTPELPRPVVGMARGAVPNTYRSSWDLATLGSPISSTFISLNNAILNIFYVYIALYLNSHSLILHHYIHHYNAKLILSSVFTKWLLTISRLW